MIIMAKRPIVEFILLLINLIFTVWGLGTLVYGLYCFVKWIREPPVTIPMGNDDQFLSVHRLLLAVHHSSSKPFFDSLPKAWFIYFLIGIGAILFIISCFGYVGTSSRSSCCLLSYFVFLVALVLIELGTATFIFLKHNWKEVIPTDESGRFYSLYQFLNLNWNFIRWVALAVFSLQVIAMILALYLQLVFNRAWHDRIDNLRRLRTPKSNMLWHPIINRC